MRTPSVHSLRLSIDVTGTRFPWTQAASAPAVDTDGTPVFLGLAAFKEGLHPCKICVEPQGQPVPFVSYGGEEYAHGGTMLLLPFDPAMMAWVVAADGEIMEGWRPVEGGVFGEAGEDGHLCGANVPYGGEEHHDLIGSGYEVLCWCD
ncbi:hypothetical protein V8D89_001036 [Ganoderma adspersum]